MTLSDLKPTVEKLCANVASVKGYSLENADGEWSDHYYCHDCAEKVLAWLKAGRPADSKPDGDHPDWASNVGMWTVNHGCEESESCLHCHSCDVMLEYSLSDVEQELEHFESVVSGECKRVRDADGIVGPMDEREWAHILKVIEGIEHVKNGAWPYMGVDPSPLFLKRKELYDRTLAMVQTALAQAGATV